MAPKKQLSVTELEAIKQARVATDTAARMGIDVTEPSKGSQVTKSYDTFLPINGLPSNGAFYANTLEGQPLKVEDLLLLESIAEGNGNVFKIFNEIFNRRLRGIPAYDILVADEIYISLWLRANSFPGYTFPHDGYVCDHCGVRVVGELAEFDFTDMDFTIARLGDVINAFGGSDSVTEVLKSSGREVTIQMKRRKHLGRVEAIVYRDYTQYGTEVPLSTLTLLHMASNIKFTDQSDIMETVSIIQELSALEYAELKALLSKYSLDDDPIVNMTCPSCEETTPYVGYPFRTEIFIPIIK